VLWVGTDCGAAFVFPLPAHSLSGGRQGPIRLDEGGDGMRTFSNSPRAHPAEAFWEPGTAARKRSTSQEGEGSSRAKFQDGEGSPGNFSVRG
jgi:hypothetical protein